jgi:hypothetical protein
MPLSEDKLSDGEDRLAIQHFEKVLMMLLQRHEHYQKRTEQLARENEVLKGLLYETKTNFNLSIEADKNLTKVLEPDNRKVLVSQINGYIKAIDLCLAYFEQA